MLKYHAVLEPARAHGCIAPSSRLRETSGTMSSGSTTSFCPSPEHVGHAPCGLLNENVRGSISAKLMPQYGHANCSENTCSSPESASTASIRPSP